MAIEKPCIEHAERMAALETNGAAIIKRLDSIDQRLDRIEKRNSFATWFYGAVIGIGSFAGALAGAMELRKLFP